MLVIIGLIVGGVLVGQDLIKAAEVRATITQVEKFNTAVNTFYGKYGALPGDMNAATASQFGFASRGSSAGEGDGNGILQGAGGCGWVEQAGETVMFWQDLTSANGVNLVEGSFSIASETSGFGTLTGAAIGTVLPIAKIGGGNYFYAWSTGCSNVANGTNFLGLSKVTALPDGMVNGCGNCLVSTPGLTVKQAFDIDKKIDDGLPTTGSVQVLFLDANSFGSSGYGSASNGATTSSATCYDTTSGNYSLSQNNGLGVNCALSFKMQAGD